ncbi:unnamed protein product [Trichogramma brassicae]|uniref:Uncharacterized protein n=1 Tax=Trichogramma brassicae TaxID=86971 RepID=A0A6H5HV31_9HYME|nr:unnamed protein product [Trichogramma brassicae]
MAQKARAKVRQAPTKAGKASRKGSKSLERGSNRSNDGSKRSNEGSQKAQTWLKRARANTPLKRLDSKASKGWMEPNGSKRIERWLKSLRTMASKGSSKAQIPLDRLAQNARTIGSNRSNKGSKRWNEGSKRGSGKALKRSNDGSKRSITKAQNGIHGARRSAALSLRALSRPTARRLKQANKANPSEKNIKYLKTKEKYGLDSPVSKAQTGKDIAEAMKSTFVQRDERVTETFAYARWATNLTIKTLKRAGCGAPALRGECSTRPRVPGV